MFVEKSTRFRQFAKSVSIPASALRILNPRHAFRTYKDSFKALREARSIKDSELVGNSELIKSKLHFKFAAMIAVSEFVGTYLGAMPAGLAAQYSTGNAYNSIWGTIVGDYFPAVTTALGTWFVLNAGFYRATHSFLRDAFTFTKIGLYATLPAYAVGAVASALVIAGINLLSPELAHKLPIS